MGAQPGIGTISSPQFLVTLELNSIFFLCYNLQINWFVMPCYFGYIHPKISSKIYYNQTVRLTENIKQKERDKLEKLVEKQKMNF